MCGHNVFVLNNDENLAIFSNNMHNLCRLNYFLSHGFSTFKAAFFLSGMNARRQGVCQLFCHFPHERVLKTLGSWGGPWWVQFHKK